MMKTFKRKLGLLEEFMEFGHEFRGGGLIVNLVYIEGIIIPNFLKQALKLVQQHHPILQVYIVQFEEEVYFQSQGITEIPLQVISKKDENETIQIAEKELHTKFTRGNQPLCRLTLLYSQNSQNTCELIITFHHGIVDGISCMHFIDDLLFYYQQVSGGEKIFQIDCSELPSPVEDLIDYELIADSKIENNQVKDSKDSSLLQLIIEDNAPANQRFTRILPRMFSQENTRLLINKCKEETTTVNSALCAAMLFAAAKLLSIDKQINLSYGLPINLRKYCDPEIPNQVLGCLMAVLSFKQSVETTTYFWDLARECQSQIHNSLVNGVHLKPLQEIKLGNFDKKKAAQAILSKKETNMGRNNIFAISNRGKFKFKYKPDNQLKIKELYFAIPQQIGGDCFWLGSLSLHDQLFCTFVYVEPIISSKRANKFADDVMMIIEKSLSGNELKISDIKNT